MPDLLAEEETLPLLDHHLPCPEAKRQLLKERTQQYPEHVKHYGASSPIWPTRTEKGEAHQLVWPQEVVKKSYHKLGPSSDSRVMDFKIFTLEITGKRTGTKPRKRRALRRLVIYLH